MYYDQRYHPHLQLLHSALASVAAQSVRNDIEVILVNDGGPSVARVVRAWEKILPIKLTELDQRVGFFANTLVVRFNLAGVVTFYRSNGARAHCCARGV